MEQFGLEVRRVLAIAPSVRGLGFAIFEGPEMLVDWGVKGARNEKNSRCLLQIVNLFERYRPDALVVEDCRRKRSRRCLRVRRLIIETTRLSSSRIIHPYRFSRLQVRKAFSQYGALTKHQIATAIAKKFP